MELKNYQREILADLKEFLRLQRNNGIADAYDAVAHSTDEDGNRKNRYAAMLYETLSQRLDDCPHVCLRVPTGGGKTLLAAHAIPPLAEWQETKSPIVLWMTPTKIIRQQTAEALNNPLHPCRQILDAEYNHRVEVRDIGDAADIPAHDFGKKCIVVVATMQSLRVNSTEGRKIYEHKEVLEPHFGRFPFAHLKNLERDEKGEVKFSFANLMHILRPIMILDEAHNAVSVLSRKGVLPRLRPSCAIEFTATPRELDGRNLHNVLCSVSAQRLCDEQMIKLPIELTEHKEWELAVNAAIAERNRLAKASQDSGDSIRPIILYQAQNRLGEVTADILKNHLISIEKIGAEKIAVATGEQRELDGINLLAPDCPIEHVITVQALKEGWDCPFASVLCSVARIQSAVAVEQLLGRVLRMPFAARRRHPALNRAYAHVNESDFTQAAQTLREKMVTGLGFEESEAQNVVQPSLADEFEGDMFTPPGATEFMAEGKPDFSALDDEEQEAVRESVEVRPVKKGEVKIIVKGRISSAAQEAIIAAVPQDRREREAHRLQIAVQRIELSESPAARMIPFAPLPQLEFFFPDEGEYLLANPDNFHYATDWNAVAKNCLLAENEFAITETAETFEITLAEGRVRWERTGVYQQPSFLSGEWSEAELIHDLENRLRDRDDARYTQEALRDCIVRNLDALKNRGYEVEKIARFKSQFAQALRARLLSDGKAERENTVQRFLFGGKRRLSEHRFEFPRRYDLDEPYKGAAIFKRHYYGIIGNLASSGEEFECAMILDSAPQVKHWIRNIPQKPHSFSLPLAERKFYPDFVAELNNGKILVVEYKGAHMRENPREQRKFEIGRLWESESGGTAFFLMPSPTDDAPSVEEQIKEKLRAIAA